MQLKTVEKDEKNLVTLTVEVDAATFEDAVAKAYKRGAGRINVPGFRKGKAPRKMIETIYGTGVFYEEAVNIAYPEAYEKAVAEAGIEPVEQADVEIQEVGPEGLTFVARVHVYPEAEVGQYKGLHAYKPPVNVEDEEVASELTRLQNRNARMVTVERPVQTGDTAVIDFEGYVDDVPFEGGKGENYQLEIGSGRFIPGFEEQLVGHSAGEECKVTVTFPTEYHAPDLAGKEAVFVVTIHEVKENEKPVLDDEFAKDVSEFDTLQQLRDDIREKLTQQRKSSSEDAFESALSEQVFSVTTVEVPEAMVSEQQSTFLQNLSYRLAAQGLDLASYLQFTNQTMEDLQNEMRERAGRQVITNLAYEKIGALEGLQISEEELEEEYNKIAEEHKMPLARVKASIAPKTLRRDLLRVKAAEFVKENAFADENPMEVAIEAPSKKTTASQEADQDTASADTAKPKAKASKAKETPAEDGDAPKAAKPKKSAAKADETVSEE